MGQDQVSVEVSVLCWLAAPVAMFHGNLQNLVIRSKSVIKSSSVISSQIGVMCDQLRVSLYIVPECHVTFGKGRLHNVWWDPHIDHKMMYCKFTFCRCKVPGLENDTFALQGDWHEHIIQNYITNASHGKFSKCTRRRNETNEQLNATEILTSCKEWVYDTSTLGNTVTSEVSVFQSLHC